MHLNLNFSDTISYENFYIASMLKKIQFENVIAYRLIPLKSVLSAVT